MDFWKTAYRKKSAQLSGALSCVLTLELWVDWPGVGGRPLAAFCYPRAI